MVMTPQQLVAAVRSKDPMGGLCESKQITKEGCDWLKQSLDPFHDLQLDSLRGYPDVSTEPTVVIKINQAIQIAAPAGLTANTNWDCHIALSPIDWAAPPCPIRDSGHNPNVSGYNLACSSYPVGGLASGTGTRIAPAGLIENFGGNRRTTPRLGAVTARLDGLLINSVPSTQGINQTFTPGHCTNDVPGYAFNNIVLDEFFDFEDTDLGSYRLIYSGFEVVNTTAVIAQQGAVTVYEYGNSFDVSTSVSTGKTITSTSTSGPSTSTSTSPQLESKTMRTFRCPPNNLSEAKIMPGARSWAAKDGSYNVAKFCDANPFQAPNGKNYLIQQNKLTDSPLGGYLLDASDNTTASVGSFASPGLVEYMDQSANIIAGPNYVTPGSSMVVSQEIKAAAPAVHFSQMNTTGAYFTGLSPTTTLFITWRVGIERMPSANNPTFLSLAQPSAVYDPNALVLYNLIAANLPPGCPVGWNDMGKWFNMIADVAKTVIPGAFPLVSVAQMILNGMGASSQARALPSVVNGMREVANIARAGFGNKGQSKYLAAQKIQAAVRNKKGKQSIPNFGKMNAKPQTPRRR